MVREVGRTVRICLGLILAAAAWPQSAGERSSFDAASVKPAKRGGPLGRMDGGPGTKDPGRFIATNTELSLIVMHAYDIEDDQLSRPSWMDTSTYDVAASVPPGATREQFRRMLQDLLADRFGLQVHHETRVVPVYELTIAKSGPKLKPAAKENGADEFVPGSGIRPAGRDSFPIVPPGRPNLACAYLADAHCTYRMQTMEFLAARLRSPTLAGVGRRVVDKTGLTGQYDFTLYYRIASDPENDAPSLEEALQEQLGLKLVPAKASLEVVVVDRAQRPSAN